MPIPPIGAAAAAQEPVTPAAPKQTLDSEVFLELLVTQLRNQDPSSPMDTTQMIAQTTQLASMEQLTSLARLTEESFSLQMRSAAADLLGREVSYLDADGAAHTGIASAVSYADQVPTVTVGTEHVTLDAVSGVTATTDS
ncbi:flagellar hook assembly protein FlgD [Occultella aeris]|uniref:Flagellar basal body rod modification protein n=1 Tax=Occultella aeris TaxID=2761496 RepID=A0A7M4DDG6_9MICO|nr:flagellar hook capping FlgD N-terminal domain-containing protein [Occultella aeris]VZO34885.1 flagellar basal body rod modification protein [Occultella aeris]